MSVSVSISTIHPDSYFRLTYCWMDGVTILVSATLSTEGLPRGHDAHCALVLALHWARAVNPRLQCRWLQLIVPQYQPQPSALLSRDVCNIYSVCSGQKHNSQQGQKTHIPPSEVLLASLFLNIPPFSTKYSTQGHKS